MCKIPSTCHNSDNFFLSSGVRIRNESESVQHNPIPQYNRLDRNKYSGDKMNPDLQLFYQKKADECEVV